jgi:hypothetical protein
MRTNNVYQGYGTHQPPKRRCHLQLQVPTCVKQDCPFNPLLFRLYLDALKGRLDSIECDAPTLRDLHVWLLLFADDFALMLESKVDYSNN